MRARLSSLRCSDARLGLLSGSWVQGCVTDSLRGLYLGDFGVDAGGDEGSWPIVLDASLRLDNMIRSVLIEQLFSRFSSFFS